MDPSTVAHRVVACALAVLGAMAALVLLATPAKAVDTDGAATVAGTVKNEGTPIADVRVFLEGTPVQTRTGADGAWILTLPEPGEYRVVLDEATLPDGVALREGTQSSRAVRVQAGQSRNVLFPLGAGATQQNDLGNRIAQQTVEGIRFGLLIALAAVGLSLIFGTTGLTNFAHGELVTFGALVAFFFNVVVGMPLVVASVATVFVCGIAGGLLDLGFWRVLRRRGTGLLAMMIVSIGLALFLRYLFLIFFGGSPRAYSQYVTQTSLELGPVTLAPKDVISMVVAIVMLLLVAFGLLRTRLGKSTRAVADNPALAAASGIDVERVILTVWVAGSALAGLAGVLLALNQQVQWLMGFQMLLLVFAGVTLGGIGTAFGALVGSLIIGLFLQLSTLVIPAELKNVGALLALILILLVRPQGIFGRSQRVG